MRNLDIKALVPPKEHLDNYVGRTINGVWDSELLDYARKNKRNILLFGPTGTAKTTLCITYAAEYELPFYSVPCSRGVEESQLFGRYHPTPDGGLQWEDGPVTKLVREGGVFLIDEANHAPASFTSRLHPLLDARRQLTLLDLNGEVITAHPDFQVIAAYNPRYIGTYPLNEAFKNRFPIKIEFGYSPEVERELVASSPTLVDVAMKLRASYEDGELHTPTSTNMLMEFEDFAHDLGYVFALENFITGFEPEERGAVRNVFDLHQDSLLKEFKTVGEDDDLEGEF